MLQNGENWYCAGGDHHVEDLKVFQGSGDLRCPVGWFVQIHLRPNGDYACPDHQWDGINVMLLSQHVEQNRQYINETQDCALVQVWSTEQRQWLDYSRCTFELAQNLISTNFHHPQNWRIVDWIYKERLIVPDSLETDDPEPRDVDYCPRCRSGELITRHSSTSGSDPYAVQYLACGHKVACFGPGEANVIIE